MHRQRRSGDDIRGRSKCRWPAAGGRPRPLTGQGPRAEPGQVFDEHLRAALNEDRLVVPYQPIIDVGTRRPATAEALVRIRTDDGLTLPESFIDVAEETGLLVAIDEHVFASAVKQAAAWVHDGTADGPQGVTNNVTARRLADSISSTSSPPPSATMTWGPDR